MKSFCVEIPNPNDIKKMSAFQDMMDSHQDEMTKYYQQEAKRLGVSYEAAVDIIYLRSRSRWTQQKEDVLVKLALANKLFPPMMEDFDPVLVLKNSGLE